MLDLKRKTKALLKWAFVSTTKIYIMDWRYEQSTMTYSLRIYTSLLITLYAPNMYALRQSVLVLIIYNFVFLISRHDKGSPKMDIRREKKKIITKINMEAHHREWNKGKRIRMGHNRKKSQQQRRVEETCPCPMCHQT